MAKLSLKAGSTSKLLRVFILDSSVTTGAGLTGLAYNSGSLTAYYIREGDSSATAITLATMTVGTWASGGFKEVSSTNMPGLYELGIPDAAIAAGAKSVVVMLKGATGMAPVLLEIELTAVDNQSATSFITGLNGVAAPSNWNLMVIDGSGRVDVSKISGTSQTARDLGASVLLSSGTGTGQISLSSGTVTAGTVNDKSGYSLAAGQLQVKKNTGLNNFAFLLVASSDHATPKTGATVTAQRSIDGGAFGACTNSVTELGSGIYLLNLSAADLNGNVITLMFTASAADTRFVTIVTQA